MICRPCQQAADGFPGATHDRCPGGTWCDCQHGAVGPQTDAVGLTLATTSKSADLEPAGSVGGSAGP